MTNIESSIIIIYVFSPLPLRPDQLARVDCVIVLGGPNTGLLSGQFEDRSSLLMGETGVKQLARTTVWSYLVVGDN